MGSPCKTVRVNKFNGLHVIILSCDPMKSMRYRGYFLDFTLPALFCRDYQAFLTPHLQPTGAG